MNNDCSGWRPSCSIDTIKARAEFNKKIRRFFSDRNVLEVETPILGVAATVDPFVDSLSTRVLDKTAWLQTSPEFYLKRLLAAGSGDIYSLGKVFRQGEKGPRHYPEFTLLEWYRPGWDEHRLMEEVAGLIQVFVPRIAVEKISYKECFLNYLSIDPHSINSNDLTVILKANIELSASGSEANRSENNKEPEADRDMALDLLMTHCIEPQLPEGLVFIFDYPASKAALARLGKNDQGQTIARRFEVYLNRLELANGYFELTDADEQQARFENDLLYRRQHRFPGLPCDNKLLAAMQQGLPDCAGVAVGVDRLLMILGDKKTIEEVIVFADF